MSGELELVQGALERLELLEERAGTVTQWLGGDFQSLKLTTLDDSGDTVQMLGPLTIDVWDGSHQYPEGWQDSPGITLLRVLHGSLDILKDLLRVGVDEWEKGTDEFGNWNYPMHLSVILATSINQVSQVVEDVQ